MQFNFDITPAEIRDLFIMCMNYYVALKVLINLFCIAIVVISIKIYQQIKKLTF